MSSELLTSLLSREAATPGFRLSYLANFYNEPVYKEVMKRHGIARGEFVVLMCLRELGTLSAQDICMISGRPKNSISQAVAKLDAAGYLSRQADATDARRIFLSITRSGRTLCEKIIPLFLEREQAMLAVLNDRQREQFIGLLKLLTERNDDWGQPY